MTVEIGKNTLNKVQMKIAGSICRYIIDQGLKPGDPLTVSVLANSLKASRTPMRPALLYLEQLGLVESKKNSGFFVKDLDAVEQRLAEELSKPQEDKLLVEISRDHLHGNLWDVVTEASLMRRYGVEREVLLNVLKVLKEDGLVEEKLGRGWIFSESLKSEAMILESYNFRKMLLSECLKEETFQFDKVAADKCRREHLALLEEKECPETSKIADVNARFHETIAGFSGNRFMLNSIQRQNRIRRFLEYSVSWEDSAERLKTVCNEHMKILDAIELGDMKRASHLMWGYLDTVQERVLKKMAMDKEI